MKRIVVIKKKTGSGQDALGAETATTEDLRIWAQRREFRGEEGFTAQQRVAGLTARYFIHYREDITPEDKLYDERDGRTYGIHRVIPVRDREQLEILATYPV